MADISAAALRAALAEALHATDTDCGVLCQQANDLALSPRFRNESAALSRHWHKLAADAILAHPSMVAALHAPDVPSDGLREAAQAVAYEAWPPADGAGYYGVGRGHIERLRRALAPAPAEDER